MKPTAIVVVGHRGAGKTTLMRQLASPISAQEGGPEDFFDLDQEMQKKSGQKISDLFKKGEKQFRALENKTLFELVRKAHVTGKRILIAAGAGVEDMPQDAHVVWLRRSTDAAGRVFLDRPSLNRGKPPLAEYLERVPEREQRFRAWADEELWLPEGYESGMEPFFGDTQDWLVPYDLTLLPQNFKNWPRFWSKRKNWGLRHVEIRDDLLSLEQIEQVLKDVPAEHIIYSNRTVALEKTNVTRPAIKALPGKVVIDWALELGPPPPETSIVSIHERAESLDAAIQAVTAAALSASAAAGSKVIAKLAVNVRDFNELEQGHQWWLESPESRAFLPRSHDGRWRWYRSLFGRKMPVHFVREGDGSGPDQPYLWQSLHQAVMNTHFGAVLGHPVEHSRSPAEHQRFFKEHGVPFVAVDVAENEWDQAFPVLLNMGLTFAAVTAPLKLKAGERAGMKGPVNTLWIRNGEVRGANTDLQALQNLNEEYSGYKKVWLWGAGAMSENVRGVIPDVTIIPARQGTTEAGTGVDLLIWATGRSRDFKWPPNMPQLKMVLDLNYGDDSPGLELAATRNLPYHSGLRMFKLQAELQRQCWRETLESL